LTGLAPFVWKLLLEIRCGRRTHPVWLRERAVDVERTRHPDRVHRGHARHHHDDQERKHAPTLARSRPARTLSLRQAGSQVDSKGAAATGTAENFERSVLGLDRPPGDGEPKAHPASFPASVLVHPKEAFEDALVQLDGDAGTFVTDLDRAMR